MNISKHILHTLAYFDVFKHPLRSDEILEFLPIKSNDSSIQNALKELASERLIYKNQNFYSLINDKTYISDRIKFEVNADKAIPNAIKYGNIIRRFPFVKAVMVSGSLSKHIMKDEDDIDFFIVSAKDIILI